MKSLRYIVVALLVLVATDAWAWNAEVSRAILMFAEENLSSKAKREVVDLLGASLSSVDKAEVESMSRLDEKGKSVTTDDKDAVVRLEKAVATLGDRGASNEVRGAALREAARLTIAIHCPANILIDNHLEEDFAIQHHNSMQVGFRYYTVKKASWQSRWRKEYHQSHGAFSAEMYLYDWRIATQGKAKAYKREAVEPRKWVEKTGERVFAALKVFKPNTIGESVEMSKMEELNNASMHDAAFHLANLLNKTLK